MNPNHATIIEVLPHEGEEAGYALTVNGQHIRTGLTYASAWYGAACIRDALKVVGVSVYLAPIEERA